MRNELCRLRRFVPRGDFLRFAAVGVVGFVVDAAVLMALVATGLVGPIGGRFISFAFAVLVTFEINRSWSFAHASQRPYLAMLATYVGVQSVGFLCNLGLYSAAYLLLPPPFDRPLFCLALASSLALVFNFAGTRLLVFRSGAASATESLDNPEPLRPHKSFPSQD